MDLSDSYGWKSIPLFFFSSFAWIFACYLRRACSLASSSSFLLLAMTSGFKTKSSISVSSITNKVTASSPFTHLFNSRIFCRFALSFTSSSESELSDSSSSSEELSSSVFESWTGAVGFYSLAPRF